MPDLLMIKDHNSLRLNMAKDILMMYCKYSMHYV